MACNLGAAAGGKRAAHMPTTGRVEAQGMGAEDGMPLCCIGSTTGTTQQRPMSTQHLPITTRPRTASPGGAPARRSRCLGATGHWAVGAWPTRAGLSTESRPGPGQRTIQVDADLQAPRHAGAARSGPPRAGRARCPANADFWGVATAGRAGERRAGVKNLFGTRASRGENRGASCHCRHHRAGQLGRLLHRPPGRTGQERQAR